MFEFVGFMTFMDLRKERTPMNQKHRELALHALAAAMGTASLALGCYTVLAIFCAVNARDAKDAVTAMLLALGCIASAMAADDAEKEIENSRREVNLQKHARIRADAADAMRHNASVAATARRHREIISEANRWNEDYRKR